MDPKIPRKKTSKFSWLIGWFRIRKFGGSSHLGKKHVVGTKSCFQFPFFLDLFHFLYDLNISTPSSLYSGSSYCSYFSLPLKLSSWRTKWIGQDKCRRFCHLLRSQVMTTLIHTVLICLNIPTYIPSVFWKLMIEVVLESLVKLTFLARTPFFVNLYYVSNTQFVRHCYLDILKII